MFLFSELDGIRIITPDACEFLERVPGQYFYGVLISTFIVSDSSEEIFRIGSTKPSALLLDAVDLLEVYRDCNIVTAL